MASVKKAVHSRIRSDSGIKGLKNSRKEDGERDTYKIQWEGSAVFVYWRRGSKKVAGTTKRALVGKGTASWDEKIVFDATIEKTKDGRFLPKTLTIKIRSDRGKSKSVIDRLEIDLAKHAEDNGGELHKLIFKKTGMEMTFRIKSTFLRVNNKKIVREVTDDDLSKVGNAHVFNSGSRVFVTQTETHVSDPTIDSESDGDEFLDDDFAPPSPTKSTQRSSARRSHSRQHSRNQSDRIISSDNYLRPANAERGAESGPLSPTSLQGYQEHIESLEKQIAHLRLQNNALKKSNAESSPSLKASSTPDGRSSKFRTATPSPVDPNDVQEQLSRALKKTEKLAAENKRLQKLISELTDAARSKIDESESADGESLRDRVKKAMISHAVTSPRRDGSAGDDLVSQVHTLTKELNKAYEKISALEEQAAKSKIFTLITTCDRTVENPNGSPRNLGKVAKILPDIEALLKTHSKEALQDEIINAILRISVQHHLASTAFHEICYWMSVVQSLLMKYSTDAHLSHFIFQCESLLHSLATKAVAVTLMDFSHSLADVFLNSPPTKMPRASLGLQRSLFIGDFLGRLSDCLGIMKGTELNGSLAQSVLDGIMSEVNRLILAELLDRPELCSSAVGLNLKLALSQIDEWTSTPLAKPLAQNCMSKLTMATEAATVLSLDKAALADRSMLPLVCPSLSVHLVHRLVESFSENTPRERVPPSVLSVFKQWLKESSAPASLTPPPLIFIPGTACSLDLSFVTR